MVLSAKHRSTLYTKLSPVVEDEEAVESMLAHFPGREGDEPINKDYLRAELQTLGAQLRIEMHELSAVQMKSMVTWMISVAAGTVTVIGIKLGIAVAILQ